MKIEFDTGGASHLEMRAVAAMLLTLTGDINDSAQVSDILAMDMPAPEIGDRVSISDSSGNVENRTITATVPAPAPPAAPPPVYVPEFDSAGIPWDSRIHVASKKQKPDGTWKLKRDASALLVEQITKEAARKRMEAQAPTAELAQAMAANPTVPAPPAQDPQMVFPADAAPPVVAPAPAPAPAPASPPPAPPAQPSAALFPEFIRKVTAATNANKMTPQAVLAIVQAHGAPNLQSLAQPAYAHLIEACIADVDAALLGI